MQRAAKPGLFVHLFLGMLFCLTPAWAAAEQWKQIDRNSRNDTLWVDVASVRREGDRVRYSERVDFGSPRTFSDGSQIKTLWTDAILDCARGTRATLEFKGLAPGGQKISMSPRPAEPKFTLSDTNPRSPDAIAFKFVCGLHARAYQPSKETESKREGVRSAK
jgi:hypothetical protein